MKKAIIILITGFHVWAAEMVILCECINRIFDTFNYSQLWYKLLFSFDIIWILLTLFAFVMWISDENSCLYKH